LSNDEVQILFTGKMGWLNCLMVCDGVIVGARPQRWLRACDSIGYVRYGVLDELAKFFERTLQGSARINQKTQSEGQLSSRFTSGWRCH
jgi:hypothetical protein